jgi:hypothetical protein
VAPTWSWTSNSEKCDPSVPAVPNSESDLRSLIPDVWSCGKISVTVEDAKVEYASSDHFGNLKAGELTIVRYMCDDAYLEKQEDQNKHSLTNQSEY